MLPIQTEEIGCVEPQPLERVIGPAPGRRNGNVGPVHCVEHCEQGDLLSLRVELLSGLECYGSTHAIAAQEVGTPRLHFPYFLRVQHRHFLDVSQRRATSVQTKSLDAIERLVSPQALRERMVNEDVSTGAMDAEEGRARAGWLNFHKGRPTGRTGLHTQNYGELFDCGSLEECSQRQFNSECLFNLSEQIYG